MNFSVTISTSDPHVGSLVQVYPSAQEAAAGITEFLQSATAASEPEVEPDDS
jgi:hypothetical protein